MPRVITIHNLAFQGQFPARHFAELGLPEEPYSVDCLEYYGDLGYLKAGLMTAHLITVVSPTYAREIMSPAGGMGLEGVLNARHDDVVGIVNGIDMDVWDPPLAIPISTIVTRSQHFNIARRTAQSFSSHLGCPSPADQFLPA